MTLRSSLKVLVSLLSLYIMSWFLPRSKGAVVSPSQSPGLRQQIDHFSTPQNPNRKDVGEVPKLSHTPLINEIFNRDHNGVIPVLSLVQLSHWQDLHSLWYMNNQHSTANNPEEQKKETKSLRLSFAQYRKNESSLPILVVFFILITVTFLSWAQRILMDYPLTNWTMPLAIIFVTTVILLFVLIILQYFIGQSKVSSPLKLKINVFSYWLETCLFFVLCMGGALFVMYSVILREEYHYIPSHIPTKGFLPEGIAILTIMSPTIVYMVLQSTRFLHVLIMIFVLFFIYLGLIYRYHMKSSLNTLFLAFCFSLFLIT